MQVNPRKLYIRISNGDASSPAAAEAVSAEHSAEQAERRHFGWRVCTKHLTFYLTVSVDTKSSVTKLWFLGVVSVRNLGRQLPIPCSFQTYLFGLSLITFTVSRKSSHLFNKFECLLCAKYQST